MKKSVAMKWVRALRSGKYKQGARRLRDDEDNFCCLGVLCEISGVEAQQSEYWSGGYADCYTYDNFESVLSARLMKRLGLKSDVGECLPLSISLTVLNDGGPAKDYEDTGVERLTFDEIADIIQIFYKDL